MPAAVACPDDATLRQLLLGELDDAQLDQQATHLQSCPRCASRAERMNAADALTVAIQAGSTMFTAAPDPLVERLRPSLHALVQRPNPGDPVLPTVSMAFPSEPSIANRPSSSGNSNTQEFTFLNPPQAADEIGRLGPYRVLKVLGKGGMGVVFQAEDPRLGRLCAVKVMLPETADRPGMRERFLREARAAAQVEHDNIIPVYQVDEERGVPFIAMPFLKGMSLEDWLRKQTRPPAGDTARQSPVSIPVPVILKLGKQIAKGLAAAHQRGLIHRDIKPANIWLDAKAGRVKILDFGLARLAESSDQQHLTQSGMIMGTPSHMAPEQARGEKLDGRADLFSLGVILYRLCTGRLPFAGRDTMATLTALATHTPPAPSTINASMPSALSDLVMQLLEKDRQKRVQSAMKVIADLQRIEKDLSGNSDDAAKSMALPMPAHTLSGDAPSNSLSVPKVAPDEANRRSIAVFDSPHAPSVLPSFQPRRKYDATLPPNWRGRRLVLAAAGAALVFAAGILLFWRTPQGTVRIEINDPAITAQIDAQGVDIKQGHKQFIRLEPGQHGLTIKHRNLTFDTNKFVIGKGDTVDLKVELLDGQIRVMAGDNEIGSHRLPSVKDPSGKTQSLATVSGAGTATPPQRLGPVDAEQARALQEAWAKHLGLPVEFKNSLGMKFRLIPPGQLTLGTPKTEIDQYVAEAIAANKPDFAIQFLKEEGPQRLVTFDDPFYLSVHEVTQDAWQRVMGDNPGKPRQAPDLPINYVSWLSAVDFCKRLSEREGLAPNYEIDGDQVTFLETEGYHLPSINQWEYGCRAGSTARYFFGDDEASLGDYAWYQKNSSNRLHPVGLKKPNPFGLHDTLGNIFELAQHNHNRGMGWHFQPHRGGTYDSPANNVRPAVTASIGRAAATSWVGFRVALPLKKQLAAGTRSLGRYRGPNGYISLFNGQDLSGWTAPASPADRWTVENGDLVGTKTKNATSLLQARMAPAGVMFRTEYQLADGGSGGVAIGLPGNRHVLVEIRSPPHDAGGALLIATGSLYFPGTGWDPNRTYDWWCQLPPKLRPFGEWNTLEIAVAAGELVVFVNGREVNRRSIESIPPLKAAVQPEEPLAAMLLPDVESRLRFRGMAYRTIAAPPAPPDYLRPTPGVWTPVLTKVTEFDRASKRGDVSLKDGVIDIRSGKYNTPEDWTGEDNALGIEAPIIGRNLVLSAKVKKLAGIEAGLWTRHFKRGGGGVVMFRGKDGPKLATWGGGDSRTHAPVAAKTDPAGFIDVAIAVTNEQATLFVDGAKAGEGTVDRHVGNDVNIIAFRTEDDPGKEVHFQLKDVRVCVLDGTDLTPEQAMALPMAPTANGLPADPAPSPTPPQRLGPADADQATALQDAWARHLGVPAEFENSIGMKFRLIPPGQLTLGTSEAEIEKYITQAEATGRKSFTVQFLKAEGPQRQVSFDEPFYLGVHEVTQEVWRRLMADNPSMHQGDARLPVENVPWLEALRFCNRLSEHERLPSNYQIDEENAEYLETHGYRLPSRDEWEYACRAGSTTRYSFGDDSTVLGDYAWFKDNSTNRTHPVGLKLPNPFGLFDVHGNVNELVQPNEKAAMNYKHQQQRGGTYESEAAFNRSSIIGSCLRDKGGAWAGLRVALPLRINQSAAPERAPTSSMP